MYALKRHKSKVSTPCRPLIGSFRDFHNMNLFYALFIQEEINSMVCNKVFSKQTLALFIFNFTLRAK